MKEKEISAIAAKIEDEQSLGSKMQKQVTKLMINWILIMVVTLRFMLMVMILILTMIIMVKGLISSMS